MMSNSYVLSSILVMAIVVFALRAFPFLLPAKLFDGPKIRFISTFLPATIMMTLVLYTFKDFNSYNQQQTIAHLVGLLTVIILHLSLNKTILSIVGGTIMHIILLNFFPI